MEDMLFNRIKKIKNLLEGYGDHIIKPDAVVVTHSTLPSDPDHIGIWWYNLSSKTLVFSKTAESHMEKEFKEKIPELKGQLTKEKAISSGWVSGRLGHDKEKIFAFIYSDEVHGGVLSGDIGVDILRKLSQKIGKPIDYFVDEKGRDLIN